MLKIVYMGTPGFAAQILEQLVQWQGCEIAAVYTQPDRPDLRAGINLNDLGLTDPTRGDAVIWVDAVSGTAVRQGLPARLERV